MLTLICDSAELELFSDSCSGTRTGIGKNLCEPTASRVENEVRQSWAALSVKGNAVQENSKYGRSPQSERRSFSQNNGQ